MPFTKTWQKETRKKKKKTGGPTNYYFTYRLRCRISCLTTVPSPLRMCFFCAGNVASDDLELSLESSFPTFAAPTSAPSAPLPPTSPAPASAPRSCAEEVMKVAESTKPRAEREETSAWRKFSKVSAPVHLFTIKVNL